MSFHVKYSPLFRVAFRDSEITDTWLEGVRLLSFAGNETNFKNYGLIAKPRPYGVEVYFKSYPDLPLAERVQSKIEQRERFRFLFFQKKFPLGYTLENGSTVRYFSLNNLDDLDNILAHNQQITQTTLLSDQDQTTITPDSELFTLKPFGIVDIYWETQQAPIINGDTEDFTDYWIDITKT